MRFKDIFTLVNGGFLTATGHSLPNDQFYKWCKFRGMVSRAFQDLMSQRMLISQECGVPADEQNVPKEMEERFLGAFGQFLDEEAPVSLQDKIPMEFYKGVYDENKTDKADIFANIEVETLILDNLFCE